MPFHQLASRLSFATIILSSAHAFAQTEVTDPSATPVDASASAAPTAQVESAPLADPAQNERAPVKPVSCSWSQRACTYPHLVLAVDAGVSHFVESSPFGFDTSVGSVTHTGPAWGVRGGAEFTPWFAIEAHYVGMSNGVSASVNGGVARHFLTSALVAEVRFTAPIPYIQPYIFIGGGVYSTSLTGSSPTTDMTGSTEFGVPVGIGFGVPLSRGVSLGAEATYHRFFGESFSANEDIGGGEPISANAVLRFRF